MAIIISNIERTVKPRYLPLKLSRNEQRMELQQTIKDYLKDLGYSAKVKVR
jgi:hypothetical protein